MPRAKKRLRVDLSNATFKDAIQTGYPEWIGDFFKFLKPEHQQAVLDRAQAMDVESEEGVSDEFVEWLERHPVQPRPPRAPRTKDQELAYIDKHIQHCIDFLMEYAPALLHPDVTLERGEEPEQKQDKKKKRKRSKKDDTFEGIIKEGWAEFVRKNGPLAPLRLASRALQLDIAREQDKERAHPRSLFDPSETDIYYAPYAGAIAPYNKPKLVNIVRQNIERYEKIAKQPVRLDFTPDPQDRAYVYPYFASVDEKQGELALSPVPPKAKEIKARRRTPKKKATRKPSKKGEPLYPEFGLLPQPGVAEFQGPGSSSKRGKPKTIKAKPKTKAQEQAELKGLLNAKPVPFDFGARPFNPRAAVRTPAEEKKAQARVKAAELVGVRVRAPRGAQEKEQRAAQILEIYNDAVANGYKGSVQELKDMHGLGLRRRQSMMQV